MKCPLSTIGHVPQNILIFIGVGSYLFEKGPRLCVDISFLFMDNSLKVKLTSSVNVNAHFEHDSNAFIWFHTLCNCNKESNRRDNWHHKDNNTHLWHHL